MAFVDATKKNGMMSKKVFVNDVLNFFFFGIELEANYFPKEIISKFFNGRKRVQSYDPLGSPNSIVNWAY